MFFVCYNTLTLNTYYKILLAKRVMISKHYIYYKEKKKKYTQST